MKVMDLEDMLKKFANNGTWMDAPVESAHLFHKRFKEYMAQYIKRRNREAGLLGRVVQYVVRFEVQGRGSRKFRCQEARVGVVR